MSVIVIDRPPFSVSIAPRRKKVRFCSLNPVTEVRVVWHKYPSDFFYTSTETHRFRKEAREERMGSAVSPVQRAFNVASSSLVTVLLLIVGMIAATIACLPILLLLKIASILFSCASQEDIDSSVQPYSPSSDPETSSFTERLLLSLFGHSSLSCTSHGNSQYGNQCVTPLLSNWPLSETHRSNEILIILYSQSSFNAQVTSHLHWKLICFWEEVPCIVL